MHNPSSKPSISVIPAQAGIPLLLPLQESWAPAFAGVTVILAGVTVMGKRDLNHAINVFCIH